MSDDTMTPAEEYAALKLLEHALKGALEVAAEKADEYRRTTRAKQLETNYGLVSLTRYKPSITAPEAALLAYAEEHAPHLIQRSLSTPAKSALMGAWEIVGDDVVDGVTGEVIEFAQIRPGRETLAVRLTPEAKDMAAGVLSGHAGQLADGFTRMLDAFAGHQLEQGA